MKTKLCANSLFIYNLELFLYLKSRSYFIVFVLRVFALLASFSFVKTVHSQQNQCPIGVAIKVDAN